jgi:hypothetical protein
MRPKTMSLSWVADLIAGRVPLPVAFWRFGIAYGFVLNLLATVAAAILFAADAPDWLAFAVYVLPIPYNIGVLVGIYRSASRWRGEKRWADLARVVIAVWVLVACLV